MCRISSKKYMPEESSWELLRGGVGWGLGTMFARQGDKDKCKDKDNDRDKEKGMKMSH